LIRALRIADGVKQPGPPRTAARASFSPLPAPILPNLSNHLCLRQGRLAPTGRGSRPERGAGRTGSAEQPRPPRTAARASFSSLPACPCVLQGRRPRRRRTRAAEDGGPSVCLLTPCGVHGLTFVSGPPSQVPARRLSSAVCRPRSLPLICLRSPVPGLGLPSTARRPPPSLQKRAHPTRVSLR